MAIYGAPVLERPPATPVAPEVPGGFSPNDAAFLESAGISAETTRAPEVARAVGAVILNDQDPSNYVALGVARVPGIGADEAPDQPDISTVLAKEAAKVAERQGWTDAKVVTTDGSSYQLFQQQQVEQARKALESLKPAKFNSDSDDEEESESSRS